MASTWYLLPRSKTREINTSKQETARKEKVGMSSFLKVITTKRREGGNELRR